ncbi:DUF805 domain-containing protein [Terricaulis sp.]|uniref:DUF805 domain-containing protein n=1 Tax=Terricaulis sp. TaxID=2768686 RepID=UPI00378468CF
MVSLLFSFHGRINRKQYWQAGSLVGVLGMMGFITLIALSGLSITDVKSPAAAFHAVSTGLLLAIPLLAFVSWSGYAIQVKRLHDRGRSGYFALLPGFISLGLMTTIISAAATNAPPAALANEVQPWWLALQAVNVWFFIDLGCLSSVEGPNRYGDPPGAPRKYSLDASPSQPLAAPKTSAEAATSLFGAQSAMDRAIAAKDQAPPPRRPAASAMTPLAATPAPATASFGRRAPR